MKEDKNYESFQESTEVIGDKKIMIWYGSPLMSKVQLGIFYGGPPPSDPRRLGSARERKSSFGGGKSSPSRGKLERQNINFTGSRNSRSLLTFKEA